MRSAGNKRMADEVAKMSEDEALRDESMFANVFGLMYKITVGYGYQPWRALIIAMVLIGIGALLASGVDYDRRKAPSRIILSAHYLIPLISFGENYTKVDLRSAQVPTRIRRYFYLHSILGFVLAAFLLAALGRLTTTN